MSDSRDRFLSTFVAHGFEPISESGDEVIGPCPFTGKRSAFHINLQKRVWHSKTLGKGGTLSQFLDLISRDYMRALTPALREILADDRGLPVPAFRRWDFGWNGQAYTLAVRDRSGAVVDIRSYRLTSGRRRMMSTSGCRVGLLGAHLLDRQPTAPVHLVEGEWDLIAFAWLLAKVGEPGVVVAVPGAGIFKPEWAEWLAGRTIHTYYDNDEAGRRGELLAARHLLQG